MTFLVATALLAGCSEEEALQTADYTAQEDLAAMEQEILTVEQWEDNLDELDNGRVAVDDYLLPPDCVERTWTFDPPAQTRVLTIDFGDEPCLGRDGLYRRGKITITYVGPRWEVGSTRSTEFIGYYVMNHQYNGTKVMEFQGHHTYDRTVDMSLQVGQEAASWQADQVVEKIAGYDTPERHDDLYQVTGEGSGVRRSGTAYTADIIEPLLRKTQPGCYQNFVDGVIEFTSENDVITLLDYDPLGGAPCDKLAAVTRNGHTHYITLR